MARRQFRMTPEQQEAILNASRPVPCLIVRGLEPSSPQENANRAWQKLADELGFVWDTARPVDGEGTDVFTAEVANGGE